MKRQVTQLFSPEFDRRPLAVRPFLIAEAGVNHEGSLETAFRQIDEAADAGADAIKFQTYKADTLAVKDSPAYWDLRQEPTRTQHELFKKFDSFGEEEFRALKGRCDERGIAFMSTPFDARSAEFLNELVDVHKISSSDLTNKPLIDQVASYGKPILLSTGASDLEEIRRAVGWIHAHGTPVALLHCVLNYPTAEEDAALGRIVSLRQEFPDVPVGYSDHTLPADLEALVVAAALGACVIEKHFTHDRSLKGNDHYHAVDKELLARLVARLDRSVTLVGRFDLGMLEHEQVSRSHARRSLVTAVPIRAGTVIAAEHLTWKRPGHGISPAEIDSVIGRVAARDLPEDQILTWDDLS